MRLLLDTHALLWFLLADRRLSRAALDAISDPGNHIEVSPASYWEIAIKISLGKYALPEPYQQFMERCFDYPIPVDFCAAIRTSLVRQLGPSRLWQLSPISAGTLGDFLTP